MNAFHLLLLESTIARGREPSREKGTCACREDHGNEDAQEEAATGNGDVGLAVAHKDEGSPGRGSRGCGSRISAGGGARP